MAPLPKPQPSRIDTASERYLLALDHFGRASKLPGAVSGARITAAAGAELEAAAAEVTEAIRASVPKSTATTLKAANDNDPQWPGLVSSGDMVRQFTPPDYSIDGIVQSGFLYSLTASTGTGKTAVLLLLASLKAQGLPLGDREVPAGRVVYFAGENPDDVTMRWIGAAHHAGFDPNLIDVHFVPGTFDITKMYAEVIFAHRRATSASVVILNINSIFRNVAHRLGVSLTDAAML